jgi:hypothetical protein
MTKPEAKALMTEVWGYLAKHPECSSKWDLPEDIYDKVKDCLDRCPLCELHSTEITCEDCILVEAGAWCGFKKSPHKMWSNAPKGEEGNAIRAASAKKIFDITEAWDTEEE